VIVIPMAGLSARFARAGYQLPKFMLGAHGETLFTFAMASFARYFRNEPFLFIPRAGHSAREFISQQCRHLGIVNFRIVELSAETRGQADTVAHGLEASGVTGETPLTIFNIDTMRRAYRHPIEQQQYNAAGALEVFAAAGTHWSFVRTVSPESPVAVEVAEKRRISDLCCTGNYTFASAGMYLELTERLRKRLAADPTIEMFVAPMYNDLISAERTVVVSRVPSTDISVFGTPEEYLRFLESPIRLQKVLDAACE